MPPKKRTKDLGASRNSARSMAFGDELLSGGQLAGQTGLDEQFPQFAPSTAVKEEPEKPQPATPPQNIKGKFSAPAAAEETAPRSEPAEEENPFASLNLPETAPGESSLRADMTDKKVQTFLRRKNRVRVSLRISDEIHESMNDLRYDIYEVTGVLPPLTYLFDQAIEQYFPTVDNAKAFGEAIEASVSNKSTTVTVGARKKMSRAKKVVAGDGSVVTVGWYHQQACWDYLQAWEQELS